MPIYSACSFDIHGTDMERAENALADLASLFKQQNLPANVVDYYIGEYEKIKLMMKTLKNRRTGWSNVTKKSFDLIHYLVGIDSIWNVVANARITRECDILEKEITGLNKNPLYYTAVKLDSILK